MTKATIKLKKPITEVELDIDENSIEAEGYVKVIRCKDCKKRKKCNVATEYHYCSMTGALVHETDFCSWAERKEE